ncbi:polysaccharide deacetylase family protein [Paenibacillus sp. RC84]|uniref:polysaccharide deacetylase family protein n=1 Tax=Paenibacillus sp. RC84 TaxID=3156252 RepID=UPI0035143A83
MYKRLLSALLLAVFGLSALLIPTGADRYKLWYRDQVAVLMYHHIHDQDTSSSTITSKLFRDQMNYLLAKGYHFITLQEFKQYLAGASVPDNAVLVTFDDGYESVYSHAYPVLKELKISAVNFIITETLADPKATMIPSMSKEELTRMSHETNFIENQCHTNASHRKLDSGEAALVGRDTVNGVQETDEQYRSRIYNDAAACASNLSPLQELPVDTVAYPYGIIADEGAEMYSKAGFRYGFTIIPQMATRDANRMHIPRINAGSPWITPERLHTTLKRRAVAQPQTSGSVLLSDAVDRLGGTVTDDGQSVTIRSDDRVFSGSVGSRRFKTAASVVELSEPVRREHGELVISLSDLQRLLGREVTYNRSTGQIYWRQEPRILTSQDSKRHQGGTP